MLGRRRQIVCVNPDCETQRFSPDQLLFVCPRRKRCLGAKTQNGIPEKVKSLWPDDHLFSPQRYGYSVTCSGCGSSAYLKVCRHCGAQQPMATGNLTTVAVIGATASGKTCFITALIKQLREELTKRARLGASVEWDDDDGRKFFEKMHKTIFIDRKLPKFTDKNLPIKTIQITVRLPLRGWRRLLRRVSGGRLGPISRNISLVFPDPAGELLEQIKEAYYINYLSQARAVILMVDPFTSNKYQQTLRQSGVTPREHKDKSEPADVLNNVTSAIRNELGKRNAGLKQELAVVLTKCDEPGLLDPADPQYRQPKQGRRYNLSTARRLSGKVRDFLEAGLGFAGVGAAADASFRRSCFFAASALGQPPRKVGEIPDSEGGPPKPIYALDDPAPRFVEDAFLWILKQWKYI